MHAIHTYLPKMKYLLPSQSSPKYKYFKFFYDLSYQKMSLYALLIIGNNSASVNSSIDWNAISKAEDFKKVPCLNTHAYGKSYRQWMMHVLFYTYITCWSNNPQKHFWKSFKFKASEIFVFYVITALILHFVLKLYLYLWILNVFISFDILKKFFLGN